MKNFHTDEFNYVSAVTLRIKDEAVMLDYYLNILKLKNLKQEPNKFYLGTKNGHTLVILEVDAETMIVNGTIGLYHYALLLPTRRDLANFTYHYLKTNGRFVGASDHHVSEAVYLEDPEGNGIEVYVDKPHTIWRDLTNNIYMTTERLDIDDLFTLVDEEYRVILEGTIMGHLHLHVNDMAKAKVFYHQILGFDIVLDFNNSATFLSDQGYHHHLAYNVWRSRPLLPDVKKNGLIAYDVHYKKEDVPHLITRLKNHNVAYTLNKNFLTFSDINGAIVSIKL